MNANQLNPKELISAPDVHDTKGEPIYLNAEISGLKQIEVGQDKERRWALTFRGTERKLTLNVTNTEKLVKLFGAETDDWAGQKIALHGGEATFGGKTVPAVRISAWQKGAKDLAATSAGFDPDEIPV